MPLAWKKVVPLQPLPISVELTSITLEEQVQHRLAASLGSINRHNHSAPSPGSTTWHHVHNSLSQGKEACVVGNKYVHAVMQVCVWSSRQASKHGIGGAEQTWQGGGRQQSAPCTRCHAHLPTLQVNRMRNPGRVCRVCCVFGVCRGVCSPLDSSPMRMLAEGTHM